MARITEFELNPGAGLQIATAKILKENNSNSHVIVRFLGKDGKAKFADLQMPDLERFAVNILKALGSKKLVLSQRYNNKVFFRKQKKQ